MLSSLSFFDIVSENVGALAVHSTTHYADSFDRGIVRLVIVEEEEEKISLSFFPLTVRYLLYWLND